MKKRTLLAIAACIATTPFFSSATTTINDTYGTLNASLRNELGSVGWTLHWSLNRDYPILENDKRLLERRDLSLGSKLRLLTVTHEVNGEFQVWLCDSYKTLAIVESQDQLNKNECATRFNTGLDRVF
ncbi:hypothetical protein [Vibrio parahaemolyticus]|uniref:hypothetical protein n=1 Tax=Vibrio parahaemolyticus TaxID=670 RepID=UPI0004DFBC54|nr:hypothetical protein [Vibrio parahaemolyticus]